MGIKKFFGETEDRGIECDINSSGDGSVSAVCRRTIKQKDGSVVTDGQEVSMSADPSNDCQVSYGGHMAVMDGDGFRAFDPVAKRVERGCKRSSKKGFVPKQNH